MKRCILFLVMTMSSQFAFANDVQILPFELPLMNSTEATTYKSTDHPRAVFVLEIFGLNCRYCNDNAPNVSNLAKKYKNNPYVQVLDVGTDRSDSNYKKWIARHNPSYPVLKDAMQTIYSQLDTTGIPTTAIVDCLGNLQYVGVGVWSATKLNLIENAINQGLNLAECGAEK